MTRNKTYLFTFYGALLVYTISMIGLFTQWVNGYFYADRVTFSANLFTTGWVSYYTGAIATNVKTITGSIIYANLNIGATVTDTALITSATSQSASQVFSERAYLSDCWIAAYSSTTRVATGFYCPVWRIFSDTWTIFQGIQWSTGATWPQGATWTVWPMWISWPTGPTGSTGATGQVWPQGATWTVQTIIVYTGATSNTIILSTGSLFSGATFSLKNDTDTWLILPNTWSLYTPIAYTQNGQTFLDTYRIIQVVAKIIFFIAIVVLFWMAILKKIRRRKTHP